MFDHLHEPTSESSILKYKRQFIDINIDILSECIAADNDDAVPEVVGPRMTDNNLVKKNEQAQRTSSTTKFN